MGVSELLLRQLTVNSGEDLFKVQALITDMGALPIKV